MPIYEYVCDACGKHAEMMQKIGEVATECPACHKPALKKCLSAPGFQLKGSGWYATDFRGKDKAKDKAKGEDKAKEEGAAPAAATACGGGGCGGI